MTNDAFNEMVRDVPVYLITGFLESGKTAFLQETLEDPQFDTGAETLLIVCEEGELEYDLKKVKKSPTEMRVLEDEEDLTPTLLREWNHRFRPDRVLIEYNGMWQLQTLMKALPPGWFIQQKFFFAESGTFMNYNANMRSLVFDKIQNADMVVFNRFNKQDDIMPYHKVVRPINRACGIVYEAADGSIKYDEIVDPLPFDKKAPVIEIQDRDYAIWYQDLNEELRSYNGKTVRFKGQVSAPRELGKGTVLVGRQMMNCCAADISFAGLVATDAPDTVQTGDWITVTAEVKVKRHNVYGGVGPVLTFKSADPAQPPEEAVATFY